MNKLSSIITGVLIFLFLFYNQEAALNISLFAFAIWVITYFSATRKKEKQTFWILSFTMLISLLSWAWYGDTLSFFALLLSTMATTCHAQLPALNVILYPFLFVINTFTLPFRVLFVTHWIPKSKSKPSLQKWFATIIIPMSFVVIFLLIYTTGSSTFQNFFQNLFSFNIDQVLLLSALSFFILFNLWVLWAPRPLIRLNTELSDHFSDNPKKSFFPSIRILDKDLEKRSGKISLILLNVLILIFIISYNYEQFFITSLPSELSKEIHDRVDTIVISILMAIGVILFYFRNKADRRRASLVLKKLAYTWLILNVLLLVSALVKNGEYVFTYGLTFKRISVFIFLLICIAGLILSGIKIRYDRTNSFLINRMTWVLYAVLIIASPINFSWIVTKFNTTFITETDTYYLRRLDFNSRELFKLYKNDPEWEGYFIKNRQYIECQKDKPFLSGHLYYFLYPNTD